MHYITLHHIAVTLHASHFPALYYITLHCVAFIVFYCVALKMYCIDLYDMTFVLHDTACSVLHCVTLLCVVLHYTTLCCFELYITLHYTALHWLLCFLSVGFIRLWYCFWNGFIIKNETAIKRMIFCRNRDSLISPFASCYHIPPSPQIHSSDLNNVLYDFYKVLRLIPKLNRYQSLLGICWDK